MITLFSLCRVLWDEIHIVRGIEMRYKAIIFDVGDTLLEQYPGQTQIYIDRMRALGYNVDTQAADKIRAALTKAAQEQIAREQNGAPRMSDGDYEIMLDKAALSCIGAEYNESECLETLGRIPLPKQELRIIPGTAETLQALKEKRFRMGIVSNHRTWLPDCLRELNLSGFFETIVVSEIAGIEKPDPRIMRIALEALSLEPSSCLYVGDHPFDVLCEKSGAGLRLARLPRQRFAGQRAV